MQLRTQPKLNAPAAIARYRRPPTLARQRDLLRKSTKPIPPVRKLPPQNAPAIALIPQHSLLPQRVVGVLHRKRRKSSRTTTQPRPIAKRQIPRQRTQRPAVPRNVMQHQKQDVLALAKRKQMRPQRHLARKIKSSLRRFRQRPRKLPFAHRANQKPKARRSPCQNLLPRYPKPLREDRAQAFVALDNIPKRSFQRPHIQLASKPNRQWDRVAPASSFQPLQKPQPALPIRQPHLTRTLNRTQRWTRCTRLPQPLNQPRYRRPLKQAADRYLNLKARTHAADQTRRKQRMAPKRKKVVVDPNSLQPQDLGKQSAQQLLTRTARQTQYRSPHLRRRQRSAVQLPVRRQRQMLQNHNRRRHHVLGKARSNMRTQRRRINLRPSRQNNIANKLRTTRPIRARNHNRLRHAVMPQQRCLDLPGLNAEAADLNLLVRSPHKLQNPIPAPARQVPAAVHPAPRSAKPIRNKALTRQPAAPNIPTTNPSTRDVKLPNYPNRHRLQTTVQYINSVVG